MKNDIEDILSYSRTKRLLYVEDNEQVMLFTRELLNHFFNDITIARDGEEGLKVFQEKEFDLVLADINMPNMNGIEMSTHIREIDSKIPIIMFSAYNEATFENDAFKAGANEYLAKPLNLKRLVELLQNIMDHQLSNDKG